MLDTERGSYGSRRQISELTLRRSGHHRLRYRISKEFRSVDIGLRGGTGRTVTEKVYRSAARRLARKSCAAYNLTVRWINDSVARPSEILLNAVVKLLIENTGSA